MAAGFSSSSKESPAASHAFPLPPSTVSREHILSLIQEESRSVSSAWKSADAGLKRQLKLKEQGARARSKSPEFNALDIPDKPPPASSKKTPYNCTTLAKSSSAPNVPRYMQVHRKERDLGPAIHPTLERDLALEEKRLFRAQQQKIKAAETSTKLKDNSMRKMRKNIVGLCHEVARRKKLTELQDKARIFRETRQRQGKGPWAQLGDHSEDALGLIAVTGDPEDEELESPASPRRILILDSLTLGELDALRRQSRFFFEGAFEPVLEDPEESTMMSSGKDQVNSEEDENLIDFFTATREEKDMDIAEYARMLRKKISPVYSKEQTRQILQEESDRKRQAANHERSQEPLQFMPCMGSKPAIRDDHLSPVLQHVKEVYHRRNAADAKDVEDKRNAMVTRFALNAFKAREQQRELQLEAFKRTEMHKVRMLEAEERKKMHDAEETERQMALEETLNESLAKSILKAEMNVEQKRAFATGQIEAWHDQVLRAERHMQQQEILKIKSAEAAWNKYSDKLWKLGVDRHTHISSLSQKNDKLRAEIQCSLVQQLDRQQKRESKALMQDITERQAAAAQRRDIAQNGRYQLRERAFDLDANRYDLKCHSGSVDRRDEPWERNATQWRSTIFNETR